MNLIDAITKGCLYLVVFILILLILFVYAIINYPVLFLILAVILLLIVMLWLAKRQSIEYLSEHPRSNAPDIEEVNPSGIESSPIVWHLDIDEIVISWGYDYQTNCFKIWTSPIITQPSTQAHLDAYSSTKRVASRRYADRQRCVSAARRAIANLKSAGWRVIQVSPPILLENLPRWVRESGGEMSDRDPIKDRQNWSKGL